MPVRCPWLLATLAVLAAANPAGAQVTGKQALKQFTSAAKGVLSDLKANLAEQRALLEVDLDALDAQLALGALSPTQAATSLHLSLSETQIAVRPLASNAFLGLYGAAGDALTALLAEWYRFYASVNKRLAKTRKLAEKQGIGLGVVFVRPFDALAGNWGDNAPVGSVGTRPLSIDTAVSASDLDLAGDGFIAVSGIGDNPLGSVTVELTRPGVVGSGELVAPTPPNDRWSTDTLAGFDNGPVVEAAYFLSARQGAGHFVDASIGVR